MNYIYHEYSIVGVYEIGTAINIGVPKIDIFFRCTFGFVESGKISGKNVHLGYPNIDNIFGLGIGDRGKGLFISKVVSCTEPWKGVLRRPEYCRVDFLDRVSRDFTLCWRSSQEIILSYVQI